jgi:EAL domain-containing protein (putative c-di-GMP-specific phosphodiesterase class I)
VLQQLSADRQFAFDEKVRVYTIDLAMRLGIDCHLNLNFLPQGLDAASDSIRSTLDAAPRANLPVKGVILEVLEGAIIDGQSHFRELINAYLGIGLKVAIDDFGADIQGSICSPTSNPTWQSSAGN